MRVDIDIDGCKFIETYGGCFVDEFGVDDDFGITFDFISISGIKMAELSKLAVRAINHLIANGASYELSYDEYGQIELKEK